MFPRQDHGRYGVSDSGTLTINPVRKEDAGEYECQALSVAGSALAKANVEVRGRWSGREERNGRRRGVGREEREEVAETYESQVLRVM